MMGVLLCSSNVNVQTASAAKYHKGVPKILRNTKWKSKAHHYYDNTSRGRISFKTTSFDLQPAFMVDPAPTFKVKSKKVSKHVYYLVGRIYNNAPAGGIIRKYKVRYYNKHKIHFYEINSVNPQYSNLIYRR